MQTNLIETCLAGLALGDVQSFRNLSVHPLLADATATPGYLTLDQALEARLARVSEISESGRVPELAFENLGDTPVLLLDGEELVGAKQNRVLNVTLLVPGSRRLTIPVSCVEMGRWAHISRELASGRRTLYARARAAKMQQVSESLRQEGSRRSNQHAIWDDIAVKIRERGAASATQAMSDAYEIYFFPNLVLGIPFATQVMRFDGFRFERMTGVGKRLVSPLVHLRHHFKDYLASVASLAAIATTNFPCFQPGGWRKR